MNLKFLFICLFKQISKLIAVQDFIYYLHLSILTDASGGGAASPTHHQGLIILIYDTPHIHYMYMR